ncbi:M48 family metallopeptidase [Paracoccus sp. (in: a-proteobacteria)]|uniref:M48 family metallopeptidase n=1 Tax=Paracoccus sp. TaxID=267 RepID=UPI0026DFA456|nr:SprT family zinc-dependent metalloprotease [Paracoccus sp. (in: a-proteobacteria)]MDO5648736.1 SprT family zinc-dependent metalloprotease [Paracoccus sp. (in: a-proteobacteria)]
MDDTITLQDGLTLRLRRSARARRMTLRVPRDGAGPVLTLPVGAPLSQGLAFAESRAGWLRAALSRVPVPPVAAPGAVIPVAGKGARITLAPVKSVQIQGDTLLIPERGRAGALIAAWLKHRALLHLRAECDRLAAAVGRPYRMIALRDTRSRWGSCSHDGRLMFSWRLAMVPPEVLHYVAAHEVAHLIHMDHSPRFWAQVESLMPGYGAHRGWLRAHGGDVMAWRFDN